MKKIILFLSIFGIFYSCSEKQAKVDDPTNVTTTVNDSVNGKFGADYIRIEATDIPDNLIQMTRDQWLVITGGTKDSFNSMIGNWGAFGEMWYKNSAFIVVRNHRYTYQFLEQNDYYTLSIFSEEYRGALNILGNKSGRDIDKVKETGLTPLEMPSGGMSYEEARIIIECKKSYAAPLDKNAMIDKKLMSEVYKEDEQAHTLFIGEIVNVWVKK